MIQIFTRKTKLIAPIFVWGAPRSGTTLLYQLLSKHPDVAYLASEEGKPLEGTGFWWQAFGEHRGAMNEDMAARDKIKKIQGAYGRMLRQQRRTRILDKSPFMTLWIPLMDCVFPDAKHIHIIRDGRAVVNSILYLLRHSNKKKLKRFAEEHLFFGPQPQELTNPLQMPAAKRHALQWVYLVQNGQKNKKNLRDRYMELHYEDLVSRPREIMHRIVKHVDLPGADDFIGKNIPPELPNRNFKWQNSQAAFEDDGYTTKRARTDEDMAYYRFMNPMLQELNYLA
jgi:hypothetical protein